MHVNLFPLFAPGAVNTGAGTQDSTRFVGRANDDNNWTYDGIDNTAIKDPTHGSNVRLVVSMDSTVNETRFGVNRVPRIEDDTGLSIEAFSIPGLTTIHDAHINREIGTTFSLIDNLSIFRGRHNLKFGGEVRRIQMNVGWNEAIGVSLPCQPRR